MEIRTLGVLGAGAMGNGIAHVAALSGLDVVLVDTAQAVLEKSMATMRKNLERQVQKGTIDAAAEAAALARVSPMTTHDAFAKCDMVIEAVPEREEIKRAVFASLLPHVSPDCILASNTSSISITRLAAGTDRPERFIGMHFMNPVPVMKLIEVIRGIATSDATFEAVMGLGARMGKTMAVAHDFPGFIVNRILIPMINEAIYALHEGVGDVTSIDAAAEAAALARV
uniref:3-hydroxyacyl-CoA dehydrogenase NAD-binding domain-containing protein n=1 Tax=Acidiphilium sp. TaxID=527 RepID=UPI00259101B5